MRPFWPFWVRTTCAIPTALLPGRVGLRLTWATGVVAADVVVVDARVGVEAAFLWSLPPVTMMITTTAAINAPSPSKIAPPSRELRGAPGGRRFGGPGSCGVVAGAAAGVGGGAGGAAGAGVAAGAGAAAGACAAAAAARASPSSGPAA